MNGALHKWNSSNSIRVLCNARPLFVRHFLLRLCFLCFPAFLPALCYPISPIFVCLTMYHYYFAVTLHMMSLFLYYKKNQSNWQNSYAFVVSSGTENYDLTCDTRHDWIEFLVLFEFICWSTVNYWAIMRSISLNDWTYSWSTAKMKAVDTLACAALYRPSRFYCIAWNTWNVHVHKSANKATEMTRNGLK